MGQQKKIYFFLVTIFAVLITIYALANIVTNPGHIMTTLGGDGVKNYYTYLYHIKYEKGLWFNGMNYPFGEHIIYTDAQPLLSVTLSYLKYLIPISTNNALAIMHLLIGLSYVLGIIFTCKILIRFNVKPLLAPVFSVLIIFLSPQIVRIGGHFGLSYVCIIPMLFYWSVCYYDTGLWRYPVYIFLLGVFVAFLHPYFAAMIFLWGSLYSVGYLLFPNNQHRLKHIIPMICSIVGVFAAVQLLVLFTDPVKDRPTFPYGALQYCTTGRNIIYSPYSPIWKKIAGNLPLFESRPEPEGDCYVGIVAIIVVLIAFISGVRKLISKKRPDTNPNNIFNPLWLFIGIVSLLFAMGAPFIWHNGWLLNYISALRQFRTFGRFSWIFYYVITIFSVVIIDNRVRIYALKKKIVLAYTVLFLAIACWCAEASGYVKYIRSLASGGAENYRAFFFKHEKTDWKDFIQENHFCKDDFQAIILLPFFDIGSEKLWVNDNQGWLLSIGVRPALQLHLPIVDIMMSRTSLSQTEKQVRIIAGPYADKSILQLTHSHKPYLMLINDYDPIDSNSKYLIKASTYLGHFAQCYVYACYPDSILANDRKCIAALKPTIQNMPVGDTCLSKDKYYINHFDKGSSNKIFFGEGALKAISGNDSIIAVMTITPAYDSQQYEFSAWILLSRETYSSPYFNLEFMDSLGNVKCTKEIDTKWSVDNRGMWFRASKFFPVPQYCKSIRCKINNDPNPSYISMDELMLRPANANIISKARDGSIMINNHLYLYK